MDQQAFITLTAVLAFAALIVFRMFHSRARKAQVATRLANGALVIDVRSKEEYQHAHFEKAVLLGVDEVESQLAKSATITLNGSAVPHEKPLVLYCFSGARSARAALMLRKAGYTDVLSAGGLKDMPG